MKRARLLIVLLLFLPVIVKAQSKDNDLQKVKDALVNSVIYCQELEKKNANLNDLIKRVAEDLKKIQTIQQLDSLKVVYGIEKKDIKNESKDKVR